ncbi:hypothetical protein NIES4074_41420 [Cylindrospermum sp. NIES-4074]|nr:hypothetical protein NIES4074_41420 [Cylindrospermum sp. NIES-4074]
MDTLFKDLFGVFKFVEDIIKGIQKTFTPSKAYSWQTLIYLSIFSWVISYFATGYIKDIIALCGWLFLIAGTAWYTTDDPVRVPGTFMPVGAVITGFLVSVFAFGHQVDIVTPRTIVLWPTVSALLTIVPEFFEGTGTEAKAQIPKVQDRQKLIILVACSMLLSCWIQFYFVIDNWLKEFPSLLADDFKRSAFVIRVEEKTKKPENGAGILDRLQPLVEEQIVERPWSEVEKWLLEANQRVGSLGKRVIEKNLTKYDERKLWRVEPRVVSEKSGYRLDILSIWTGPSLNPRGYYLKKSCRITPVTASNKPDSESAVAEIVCDRFSKLVPGAPPAP